MMRILILPVVAAFAFVARPAVMAAEQGGAVDANTATPQKDAQTCSVMMQGSGATAEGSKAMQEFMQSPKGAQAMSNMMEMMGGAGGMKP